MGELPLRVNVNGRDRPSDSRYAWTGGGLVLTVTTVLPERGLAFELISTYVGHRDTDTIATYLVLGTTAKRASKVVGTRTASLIRWSSPARAHMTTRVD